MGGGGDGGGTVGPLRSRGESSPHPTARAVTAALASSTRDVNGRVMAISLLPWIRNSRPDHATWGSPLHPGQPASSWPHGMGVAWTPRLPVYLGRGREPRRLEPCGIPSGPGHPGSPLAPAGRDPHDTGAVSREGAHDCSISQVPVGDLDRHDARVRGLRGATCHRACSRPVPGTCGCTVQLGGRGRCRRALQSGGGNLYPDHSGSSGCTRPVSSAGGATISREGQLTVRSTATWECAIERQVESRELGSVGVLDPGRVVVNRSDRGPQPKGAARALSEQSRGARPLRCCRSPRPRARRRPAAGRPARTR